MCVEMGEEGMVEAVHGEIGRRRVVGCVGRSVGGGWWGVCGDG